jgi:hypothetical protein
MVIDLDSRAWSRARCKAGSGNTWTMAGTTTMAARHLRVAFVAGPAILIAGLAAWLLFFALDKSDAQTSSGQTALATPSVDAEAPATPQPPGAADQPAAAPQAAEPLGHLRILRQSFRRGGLGSRALMTFTLRNDNDYAIKDPEILCSFRSRDGRYSTERRRTINDIVDAKSRKAFPQTLVGFVNIKASLAKCSLVTASRG